MPARLKMKLITLLIGQVPKVQFLCDDNEMTPLVWDPSEVIRNIMEHAFTLKAKVKLKLGGNNNVDVEFQVADEV